MKRKVVSILLAAIMCLSLVACGNGGTEKEKTASDGSKKDSGIKVAVVYSGNLGDKSYNDSMCLSLVACGNGGTEKEKTASDGSKKDSGIKVAVVYSGNLGDKSYNDSCNEGAQRAAKELGVEVKNLEGTTAEEWEANFLAAAEGGYDLVICSSSNLEEYLKEYAPSYPDVKFAIIDSVVEGENVQSISFAQNQGLVICSSSNLEEYLKEYAPSYPDVKFAIIDSVVEGENVQSISFAQNQGSFLAGAAAAMFTKCTDIEGVNDKNIIGWVGGMDVPVLHDFYVGYEQGAKYIGAAAAMFTKCTDIEGVNDKNIIGWVGGMDVPVLHDFYVGYEQGAKYIAPDIEVLQSFAGTWSDPLKGKELTLAQYDQGADIVMNVASGTGAGVLDPDIEVLQSFAGTWSDPLKGKELTLAQYDQGADIVMNVASGTGAGVLEGAKEAGKYAIGVDLNQDNDQPGSILTSMVKRVDTASYTVIESVVKDKFEGNTTEYLEVANEGVGLTDFSVMKEHLGDQFPQEIIDKVNELAEKIKNGEIVVDNYKGFGSNK